MSTNKVTALALATLLVDTLPIDLRAQDHAQSMRRSLGVRTGVIGNKRTGVMG